MVLLSARLGAKKLIAIEPDPRLTSILRQNLNQVTDSRDVEIIQAAVLNRGECVIGLALILYRPRTTE